MARLQSQRDTPGTAREYETIYILRPNTPNEGVAEVNTRIRGIIENMGGKIIKVDNWGKRRLAYEVAKERKGIYLYWQYLATPGVVEETERNLRMLDSVIRYLSVKVEENIDVTARPSEIDDASYEKAATTAADEEDLFLSRGGEDLSSDGDDDDDDFGGDDFDNDTRGAKSKAKDEDPTKVKDEPAADAPTGEDKE
ncbi:MAG: 30S ribosomal protein S6 [Deltaproteobacteria bacterium]|nr:30S ribosomal protein S6 [Deltaproteobacteria bacterium]MDQ3295203.1 30S ribosomal protein S6 [Myxococcota bacterium]